MGWQWHQLDHMQVICTSVQTNNHANTPSLVFLWARCSSCYPTNSAEAPKARMWATIRHICEHDSKMHNKHVWYDKVKEHYKAAYIWQPCTTAMQCVVLAPCHKADNCYPSVKHSIKYTLWLTNSDNYCHTNILQFNNHFPDVTELHGCPLINFSTCSKQYNSFQARPKLNPP